MQPKQKTIFGFQLPWNVRQFSSDLFVKLQARHLEQKIEALKCYGSQAFRPYFDRCENLVKGLACVRGLQCNEQYAEAFQMLRGVI